MKWEYKVVFVNVWKDSAEDKLNELGEDGWELVSVHQGATDYQINYRELYLKRIKEE